MIVEDKRSTGIPLNELTTTTVFECDTGIYIKVKNADNENEKSLCFCVRTGDLEEFSQFKLAEKLIAKLLIKQNVRRVENDKS